MMENQIQDGLKQIQEEKGNTTEKGLAW